MLRGKYNSWVHYWLAYLYRAYLRSHMTGLVSWENNKPLQDGCTAIIGMCSWLPEVLPANLRCLETARWPELKEVIIVVDTLKQRVPEGYEHRIRSLFPQLSIRFSYYDEKQFEFSQKVKLPYVFAWMSWAIGLGLCETKSALIHDYDALVFGDSLEKRYKEFIKSDSCVQGVKWYFVNGIVPEDHLATTFEALVDVPWVKQFPPLKMFNQVGKLDDRGVDFDILLDIQANHTPREQRTIMEMGLDDLVHPSQMIHQYTIFKKNPGRPWNCYATTMIPFFYYLSGNHDILRSATLNIKNHSSKNVNLLGDGCIVNYSFLNPKQLDEMLRYMVQACIKLDIEPFRDLLDYGNALYELGGISSNEAWNNGFSHAQKKWIQQIIEKEPDALSI